MVTYIRIPRLKSAGYGKAELVFTAEGWNRVRELIHNFTGSGIIQGIHNTDKSISSFAHACFKYALDTKAGSLVCYQGIRFPEIRS